MNLHPCTLDYSKCSEQNNSKVLNLMNTKGSTYFDYIKIKGVTLKNKK